MRLKYVTEKETHNQAIYIIQISKFTRTVVETSSLVLKKTVLLHIEKQ